MPLYDYKCPSCGNILIDVFAKPDETISCSGCGTVCKRLPSMPARTPSRWGDSTGHYSVTFGRYFNSQYEKDKYAESKGFYHIEKSEAHKYNPPSREQIVKEAKEEARKQVKETFGI